MKLNFTNDWEFFKSCCLAQKKLFVQLDSLFITEDQEKVQLRRISPDPKSCASEETIEANCVSIVDFCNMRIVTD